MIGCRSSDGRRNDVCELAVTWLCVEIEGQTQTVYTSTILCLLLGSWMLTASVRDLTSVFLAAYRRMIKASLNVLREAETSENNMAMHGRNLVSSLDLDRGNQPGWLMAKKVNFEHCLRCTMTEKWTPMKSGPPGPNLMGIGPMRFGPPFEIHYL